MEIFTYHQAYRRRKLRDRTKTPTRQHGGIVFTAPALIVMKHLLFIFQKRMHQIMTTCFHSVRQKLHRRTGTFDLLGFDFLIDEDFKVSLPLDMSTFVSHSAFTINLGDHNSGKNRRRQFSSKSLLGYVTYSCDVKPTWRVAVSQPRFQAISPLPQRREPVVEVGGAHARGLSFP